MQCKYYKFVKSMVRPAQYRFMMPRFTMKTFIKILFAPLLWLLHACSPLGNPVDEEKSDNHYYNNKKTDIRYSPMGNWFELGNAPMHADVESFEVLTRFISRDKNRAYFKEDAFGSDQVDLGSFFVKEGGKMADIGFDKSQVYVFTKVYGTQKKSPKITIVEGADPETYVRTDWDWANDGKNHFYRNQLISVDFDSFQTLSESFSKDRDSAYFQRNGFFSAIDADVKSFKVLHKYYYAQDKHHVFYAVFAEQETDPELRQIPIKDDEKVALLNEAFIQIGNQIYFGTTPLQLDAAFTEILSTYYIKDKSKVYYQDRLLEDADAETFGPIGKYQIGDKNGPFRAGERLEKEKSNQ